MKQIAWLFACALAGCQQSAGPQQQPPPIPAPASAPASAAALYRQDLENLCDAVVRSGAAARPVQEHQLLIAQWLGQTLTTDEAHQFLVKIQPLEGEPKAAALEAEAARVGLTGCALAAVWRGR